MFWGATLALSWNLPHYMADVEIGEVLAIGWIIPILYSIVTISTGISYLTENWE